MLTITAAAREFGCHRDTIYEWIRRGKIQAVPRPGMDKARYRIPRSEVDRLKGGG